MTGKERYREKYGISESACTIGMFKNQDCIVSQCIVVNLGEANALFFTR